MKNLIIGYKRGKNKWKCLSRALRNINQEVDVVTEDFDKIKEIDAELFQMKS